MQSNDRFRAWQNPDQERANHNARVYLKSALLFMWGEGDYDREMFEEVLLFLSDDVIA